MVVDSEKLEIPRVVSRTLPGPLHPQNKCAIDWGWCGLVAYGCQFTVVVVDPSKLQIVQTLDRHKAHVLKVRWCRRDHPLASLVLASSDATGHIIVWNVIEGLPLSILQDGSKPVQSFEWLYQFDGGNVLLAALHPPYSLIVWDTEKDMKRWKKTYTEVLVDFDFDPFEASKLAFLCNECILLVDDFYPSRVPSSNGRKFAISTAPHHSPSLPPSTRMKIKRIVTELVAGETKRTDDGGILECLQLCFHRACKDILLLLYPRELLVLDLQLNQTVGIVVPERNSSPFQRIFGCRQRDVIYCLHENGIVGGRVRKHVSTYPSSSDTFSFQSPEGYDVTYECKCQSDSIRVTKHCKVQSFSVCPKSESKIVVSLSDGRLVFLELQGDNRDINPVIGLPDFLSPTWQASTVKRLRLLVSGLLFAVASPPLCIRMCPPLTVKNWAQYRPYLAAGNTSGNIQIFNLTHGMVEKEICVHTCSVRGIEWASLKSILSYGYPTPQNNQQMLVRNEVMLTDLTTGKCKPVRADRNDESPIDIVRISYLKQYFIIGFREDPFELWDMNNLIQLRNINKKFPILTAVEWSPAHYSKVVQKRVDSRRGSENIPAIDDTDKKSLQKEHFVFTDTEGRSFHYFVEGSVVKDGTKIRVTNRVANITSIGWKGDSLVWGDSDGSLAIWDLKTQHSHYPPNQHRGSPVRKVRFAPGKGNYRLLVLYSDAIQIWDVKEMKPLERMSSPKDMVKILDGDWAASDKPVISTADGCIRILDLSLTGTTSHMSYPERFICPAAFGNDVLANSRLIICNQPWLTQYSLDHPENIEESQGFIKDVYNQLMDMDVKEYVEDDCVSIPERCRVAAYVTGHEWEFEFWTLVKYYLDGLDVLDSYFDVFCDNDVFRHLLHERVLIENSKRVSYEQTQKVIEKLIMLGELDKATQTLLETDNKQSGYYADSLRACLVATLRHSLEESQSTVKLVATNLIASDKLHEGIQLLCMIEKFSDACRYMQSYGLWESALVLAKLTLSGDEKTEVYRRWIDKLCSTDQKRRAVFVWICLGNFLKACEVLLMLNEIPVAARLIESCKEKGKWESSSYHTNIESVVCREMAKHCNAINNKTASQYYCKQLGEEGNKLMQDLLQNNT